MAFLWLDGVPLVYTRPYTLQPVRPSFRILILIIDLVDVDITMTS